MVGAIIIITVVVVALIIRHHCTKTEKIGSQYPDEYFGD